MATGLIEFNIQDERAWNLGLYSGVKEISVDLQKYGERSMKTGSPHNHARCAWNTVQHLRQARTVTLERIPLGVVACPHDCILSSKVGWHGCLRFAQHPLLRFPAGRLETSVWLMFPTSPPGGGGGGGGCCGQGT